MVATELEEDYLLSGLTLQSACRLALLTTMVPDWLASELTELSIADAVVE